MKTRLLVIGSTNMDLVGLVDRLPKPGETILGRLFSQNPGGKGANQAVAAAKLGAHVSFVSSLGNDLFGDQLCRILKTNKVSTKYIKRVEKPSGVALIGIDNEAENSIIVIPGANHDLRPSDLLEMNDAFDNVNALLIQLEIPLKTVEKAIVLAHKKNIPVILNPAPAHHLTPSVFPLIDVLIPNETEATLLAGKSLNTKTSIEDIGNILLKKGIKNLIITLGSKGAFVMSSNTCELVKAPKVKAINTVAAGDAFCGGFALAYAGGMGLLDSTKFAVCVGATKVTRSGALEGMPTLKDVMKLYKY